MVEVNRRQFVRRSAAVALVAATRCGSFEQAAPAAESAQSARPTFVAFTESFQGWPIPQVCERFKGIGLDGLDLTVRPGGHIAPEDAPQKLPEAVRAARDHDVRIAMLTTAIVETDKQAESLLATAGELGIDRVKLGYYRYEGFGTLAQQIDAVKKKIAGVARLAAKHKVLPCVHIHSGTVIPSGGAVAYLLLKDFSPTEVGAYVDPMHMALEGGSDGWRQGLDLLAPWIAISSLKNAQWTSTGRDAQGQERFVSRKCPLADGIAPIPDYLAALDKLGYRGLYTLHSEYLDGGSWRQLSVDECLEQTRLDLEYARRFV
ncbi:MAG: sugar phosphate isomerase/epimerase family protein [Pirellulales bacterium]